MNVIEILATIANEELIDNHPLLKEKLEAEKALYEPRTYKRGNTCYPVSNPKERKRNERRTARRNNRNPKTPFKHTRAALKAEPWHDKARERIKTQKLIAEGLNEVEENQKLSEERTRLNVLYELALHNEDLFLADYIALELELLG